jgi:hypothetical protein
MHYQAIQGTRRLVTAAARVTSDIGDFRLFGLPPGPVLSGGHAPRPWDGRQAPRDVCVDLLPQHRQPQRGAGPDDRSRPDADRHEPDAAPSAICSSERQGVRNARTTIGRRTCQRDHPIRAGAGLGASKVTGAKPDGTFTLASVAPGDYILRTEPVVRGSLTSLQPRLIKTGGRLGNTRYYCCCWQRVI